PASHVEAIAQRGVGVVFLSLWQSGRRSTSRRLRACSQHVAQGIDRRIQDREAHDSPQLCESIAPLLSGGGNHDKISWESAWKQQRGERCQVIWDCVVP